MTPFTHKIRFAVIHFWAIPKSFKTLISSSTHQRYEFRSEIEATEPGNGSDKNRILQVELICTLNYKISERPLTPAPM